MNDGMELLIRQCDFLTPMVGGDELDSLAFVDLQPVCRWSSVRVVHIHDRCSPAKDVASANPLLHELVDAGGKRRFDPFPINSNHERSYHLTVDVAVDAKSEVGSGKNSWGYFQLSLRSRHHRGNRGRNPEGYRGNQNGFPHDPSSSGCRSCCACSF